jgi:hypothetical protein
MVNRLWRHHFWRGIVETMSNFGKTGSPPTHPELLDWLAVEFVESGWSLKKMPPVDGDVRGVPAIHAAAKNGCRAVARFDPCLPPDACRPSDSAAGASGENCEW